MKTLKIGCCGFPVSRKKYVSVFKLVELQNTFYNLPTINWARKIRGEVPEDFEFTVKAWQVITHPSRSPTWRRLRKKPMGDLNNYGWLKPTRENFNALSKTLEIAKELGSRIIILQTPSSMPFNNESIEWISKFFEEASRIAGENDIMLGWEPRGEWSKQGNILREILCKYNVIHVTDLLKIEPVCIPRGILYTRLHGLNGEVNYRYKYTDKDLARLLGLIKRIEFDKGYILFNNVYMFDDAKKFKELASMRGFKVI